MFTLITPAPVLCWVWAAEEVLDFTFCLIKKGSHNPPIPNFDGHLTYLNLSFLKGIDCKTQTANAGAHLLRSLLTAIFSKAKLQLFPYAFLQHYLEKLSETTLEERSFKK